MENAHRRFLLGDRREVRFQVFADTLDEFVTATLA